MLFHRNCKCDKQIDESKRKFLLNTLKILGGIGAVFTTIPFLSSLSPSKKTFEQNNRIKVNIKGLTPGSQIIVEWRGKPVWIIHRTQAMLNDLNIDTSSLRDPNSLTLQQPIYAQNKYRSINPKYLVLIGLCTHLGCSPKLVIESNKTNKKTDCFLCPCHGSRFDLAGRVYKKMPAPINLEVPPYRFLKDDLIEIG